MALQMISRFTTADYGTWKTALDGEREALGEAGLSVLQVWHEDDTASTAWVLFRVNDRGKARRWIDGGAVAMARRAGITGQTHTLVQTA